jgi:hypothetical protein
MRPRLRNVLILCLALLVIIARMPTSHASHDLVWSIQQTHHCDDSSGAPNPANRSCSDLCPFCQSTLQGSAILSTVPSIDRFDNRQVGLGSFGKITEFAAQSASWRQYARAPPSF